MIALTALFGAASAALFAAHGIYSAPWIRPAAITALTFFYHLAMRLAVGETVTLIFKNRSFPQDKPGFRIYPFENRLYRFLKVKSLKAGIITAKPEQFDLRQVNLQELLHNMMQAELVHRIIMLLSFVPLLFIIPFGEPAVFIITSLASAALDGCFVIIQRYNRPRVIRLLEITQRRSAR